MPTTANGLRYPALSAAPNVPQDVQNLASDVDTVYGGLLRRGPHVCTSTTRPSSPATGLLIYETDLRCVRLWDGAAWRRYAYDAQTYPSVEQYNGVNDTSSSATYIQQGAAGPTALHGVVFVGPPSGVVRVYFRGHLGNNAVAAGSVGQTASNMSDYVRTGTTIGAGGDFLVPSDDRSTIYAQNGTNAGTKYASDGVSHLVTGLTPGASYNVVTVFKAVLGTAAVAKRWISVDPIP